MKPEFQKEKILYTVQDLAQMMGMSDSAIRMHLFRRTGFLPEPIHIGTKKLVWTQEQLETHFRALTPPPFTPPSPKKPGRPSKRESLARKNGTD